jgi:uncharacterized protein
MRIELPDDAKRERTLRERGYDLAEIDETFFEGARTEPGHSGRMMAIGPFRGRIVTVIFKPLGTEAITLVTMRLASRKERRDHD